MKKKLVPLLLIAFRFIAPSFLYAQTDFEKIIQNVIAETKRGITATTTSINAGTTTLINNMWANGAFTDITYSGDDAYTTHLTRLRQMALAYTFNGATHYNSATLYSKIVLGLEYWNGANYDAVNWYADQIGYPQLLGEMLILMRGSSGTTQLPAADESTAINYLSTRLDPSSNTGANRVDEALHWIYRGALTASSSAISNALTNIKSTMVQVSKGSEGINPDNAFLQHNPQLMTQGYGSDFLNSVYDAGLYLKGTGYTFTQAELDVVFNFAHRSFYGGSRGRYKDFSLDGRGISRANNNLMNSTIARKGKAVDPVHAAEFINDSLRVTGAQPPGYNLATPYHIHYWTGDYTLHKRAGYSFSVRANSTRTIRTESINGENLLGKWLSDGATSIRIGGGEYDNIFPVWDWNKVPGITMRQFATQQTNTNGTNSYGSTGFVGGVSDSSYGASTYQQANGSVTAHKSWFFFDNEVVCLGAGITSTQPEAVATTLNQALLNGAVSIKSDDVISALPAASQQTYNGNTTWVLHDNVGYFFPAGGNVTVSNQTQTGSWSRIGTGSSAAVSADVFRLWLDHGAAPTNASYAYIVAPGISSTAGMDAYNSAAVQILSNTTALQAVQHTGLNQLQVIFSSAGTLTIPGSQLSSITADKSCALLVKDINTANPVVSIADPAQQSSVINLTLTFLSAATQNIVCNMPTGDYRGSSVRVTSGGGTPPSFTPGVLAVVRIGGINGTNGLTGTTNPLSAGSPVHIDKYAVTGASTFTYQGSIDLPANGTNKIFMSASVNEGYLTQSANRQWLSVMGYAATGSGNVYNTTTNPNIARVLGLVKYDGTVNLSTALANYPVGGTAATVSSCITNDGTGLWSVTAGGTSGAMGVHYTITGTTNATAPPSVVVSTTIANNRTLGIFGGDLYYTANAGSRIGKVSASGGLPVTTGNTMTGLTLAAGSTAFSVFSPSQMVMFDLEPSVLGYDVMYVANSSTTTTLAGIYKYCKNAAGEWVSYGTYGSIASDGSYFGITGEVVNGLPVLYATRGITTNTTVSTNQLVQLLESNGYNAAMNVSLGAVTDATVSGKGGTIRGVAFYPAPSYYYKGTGNLNELSSWGTNPDGTGAAPANFTDAGQTFFIANAGSAAFSGDFAVSGANSKIIVGDGTNATTLTVPAGFSINGPVEVFANAAVNIQNEQLPSFKYVAQGSAVVYSAAALQTITPMAYGNITNTNSAGATIDGVVTVAGTFTQAGVLKGGGTLAVPNGLTNNGTLAPGNSAGLFTVQGNFTNASVGTLAIELGGNTAAGTDYDQLSVTGNAVLNGTLDLSLINAFTPAAGQTFTIVTAASVNGSFTTVNWPAGVTGTVNYNSNNVTVTIGAVVLPLRLVDFTASLRQNGSVALAWETASEENVSHFEVERSTGAQPAFAFLQKQAAAGSGGHHYAATDPAPAAGWNAYRLKMVDKDGQFRYSKTVHIKTGHAAQSLVVYPNPATHTLTLLHDAAAADAVVYICHADGREALAQKLLPGAVQSAVNVSSLKPGWYILTLTTGSQRQVAAFVKQ